METLLKVILIILLVILSLFLLFCIYLAGVKKGYDQAVNDCIDCLNKAEKEYEDFKEYADDMCKKIKEVANKHENDTNKH